MSAFKERVDNMFAEHGESIMINDTIPAKGVFLMATLTTLNTFFDGVELSYLDRPALMLQMSADVALALEDSVTRDGRTFSVKKLFRYRYEDEPVMQAAILA
jgi:hypothetical protein